MALTVSDSVEVEPTRGSHYRVVMRRGEQVRTVVAAKTPGDWRSKLNTRSDMRRAWR